MLAVLRMFEYSSYVAARVGREMTATYSLMGVLRSWVIRVQRCHREPNAAIVNDRCRFPERRRRT
ncbi:hypothetical protein TPB0596_38170 [Tsukamurella pulmonis]|nr:hypothetical protein TPB0596_38170 [Tsukamurella pulmonis]